MKISVSELKELVELVSRKQHIKVVDQGSVTITVDTKKNSEVLLKPLDITYKEDLLHIDTLGLYSSGDLRIWVVKK